MTTRIIITILTPDICKRYLVIVDKYINKKILPTLDVRQDAGWTKRQKYYRALNRKNVQLYQKCLR